MERIVNIPIGVIEQDGFETVHMTGYDLPAEEAVQVELPLADPNRPLLHVPMPPHARMFADFTGLHAKADAERHAAAAKEEESKQLDWITDPRYEVSPEEAQAREERPRNQLEAIKRAQAQQQSDHEGVVRLTPTFAVGGIIDASKLRVPQILTTEYVIPKAKAEAMGLGYPDGNPKTAAGSKKPDLTVVPPSSLLHLATAMMNGAEKYGPFNWRDMPISVRPYVSAAFRHLSAFLDGEDYSADTVEAGRPVHHLAHVMACCAIVLDAFEVGAITDNRPNVKGRAGEMIELYNKNGSFTQQAA